MENKLSFAQSQDQSDELAHLRNKFYMPQKNNKDVIYFTGNSLGLQPKTARKYLETEMQKWQDFGVEGHFEGKNPWFDYHKILKKTTAKIIGAKENEVTNMNSLSTNIHFLLASFYKPQGKRTTILIEKNAFPSDQYIVETQAQFYGLNPEKTVIELESRQGEQTHRTEDIIAKINEIGEELALVLIGGVNYYTGQFFELEKITKAGHDAGAIVGFDLAHAVGNVILKLHDWQVDFATWCSYKYLNSSPGGVSGIFIHEKHFDLEKPKERLAGWWGYDEATRFQMKKGFKAEYGADGWQLSNVPILLMAVHKASLDIFEEVGMERLRAKSEKLTAFAEFVIKDIGTSTNYKIDIITPSNPSERGCQLSLIMEKEGKKVHEKLEEKGIIIDWREPDVIRLAPVPLYNTFEDVYQFGQILESAIKELF